MTLFEWLEGKLFYNDDIALRERGYVWDLLELFYFVMNCEAIKKFPLGQHFRDTHIYEEGHWLISEETGSLLYEIVAKPPERKEVVIKELVVLSSRP